MTATAERRGTRTGEGLGTVRSSLAVLRANTVLPERPDRIGRAVMAALPYGLGMLAAVAASAARYPGVPAIVAPGEQVTYRQLWRGAGALAKALADRGITPESRIGVLCRNAPAFGYAMLGAVRLGADVVFLNTSHGEGQLADTIGAEGLDVVLHDDEFAPLVTGVPAIPASELRELVTRPARWVPPPRREARLVILTSGTTGRPKGAARPSGGKASDGVAGLLARVPYRARTTMVIPAPFFHAWGLTNLLVGLGLSMTIVTDPEFDPARCLESVVAHEARALVVVPAMLQRICALPAAQLAAADTSALTMIVSSGSALPAPLVTEVLDRFGPVLYNIYGSTEVAMATVAAPADLRRAPSTAGRRAPGVRVEVVDAEGTVVPDGTTGRIFVGSAARFSGYTGGGGKESVDGMLSSGDLGHFDERGLLFVDGREDDMIVSGGENVYPIEVEDLLSRHDTVAEVVVVGVPDERFGQALRAFVVPRAGATLDLDELKEFVARRLARFKVPREFVVLDELPRTATGKVLRRELR